MPAACTGGCSLAMSQTRLSAIAFALCVAVLLAALGLPRLAAGIIAAPFDDTTRALGRGEVVSDHDISFARSSRSAALAWADNARLAAELGALNFKLATQQPRGSVDRAELIERVIEADRLAASMAPTAPFSWMRLAQAKIERDGAGADIANELRMSYLTAPNDARLVLPRLDLALAVWHYLPEDIQAMTADQIRFAMRWYPRELVERTRARYRLAQVRDALRDDPEARARFNLLYFLRRPSA